MKRRPSIAPTQKQIDALAAIGVEFNYRLEEVELTGEGNDRAFRTPSDRKFRIRLKQADDRVENSPNHDLAPSRIVPTDVSYALTVAELDEDNRVVEIDGRLSLFQRHEIPITESQLAHPSFSLTDVLRLAITDKLQRVERVADNRRKMAKEAAEWGIEIEGRAI